MGLKELNLRSVYYSDDCALLTDFYIPVLSNAVKYDRIAGYFCSNSLAIAARGIAELIKNNGHVRIIANVIISEEDQDAIKEALKTKEQEILVEIDKIEDQLAKNHIKMLSWLLKNNLLEIKIAIVKNGIEHQKMGILEDKDGNKISFSGSENETVSGWLNNDEQFHVFCSWKDGDQNHLMPDVERFNVLWNDRGNNVRVFPVSEAFKLGLLKNAPKNDSEFQKISKETLEKMLFIFGKRLPTKKEIKLRGYQKEAIQKWINNKYRGIFEMATGTGKTIAALGCLSDVYREKEKLVTVVCCPYNHLILQWHNEIKQFGFGEKIIIADGSNRGWKNELANCAHYMNEDYLKRIIIITTYNTFSSQSFIEAIGKFKNEILLIADEMHWSGAESYSKGLLENYNLRLGLSATPKRYLDDEGSHLIQNYFGDTVYEFDLKRAISEINPDTGKTYLTPYDYYPSFVELDYDEFESYLKITKKMARMYHIIKNRADDETLQRLAEKRQKIITNASQKLVEFRAILSRLGTPSHTLIYCSDKQIDQVQRILGDLGIINHRFTGEEGTTPSVDYEGMSQREWLLRKFADGTYQVLVAMKCLDEGVDVPPARTAIILASSGNPKEYIQRRGRVLRRYEGKEKAIIYDILIVPSLKGEIPEETKELEKHILLKEINRYEEFARIGNNYLSALNQIFPIKRRYGLT